jgi:hypothetical protein
MVLLSKDAILAADDRQIRDVDVPEWGGTVRVRALSGLDRDAYEAAFVDARKQGGPSATVRLHNFRAKLVVRSLVDSDGERLFSDTDAKALGEKSADVIDRLFDVAREMSGMDDNAVKDAEGNSETAPNGGSTTD